MNTLRSKQERHSGYLEVSSGIRMELKKITLIAKIECWSTPLRRLSGVRTKIYSCFEFRELQSIIFFYP